MPDMAGDSHTAFDAGAFTVGAIGGAATIAGALGAGLANFRTQRQSAFADWQEHQLRAALELSEAFRENDQRIILAQRITISRLRSRRAIERARSLRRC